MNILANDGISPSGYDALVEAGHTVYTDFIEASELEPFIKTNNIDGLLQEWCLLYNLSTTPLKI